MSNGPLEGAQTQNKENFKELFSWHVSWDDRLLPHTHTQSPHVVRKHPPHRSRVPDIIGASTSEPHRYASNLESVTRYVYIYIYIDRRVVTFLWASPVWRQTGQAQKNGAQSLRTGPKWYTTCTSSRFFAKYTHFAIVCGGSAGRGTLLLWNGGWSIPLAALREELRRSKVRLEPWSSGHYRLLSRPGQAFVWRCVGVHCSTRHACITSLACVHVRLAGHFSSEREHCKSCTGLVSFALSFAIGFRELVDLDQAADDCACASFQSWMC